MKKIKTDLQKSNKGGPRGEALTKGYRHFEKQGGKHSSKPKNSPTPSASAMRRGGKRGG